MSNEGEAATAAAVIVAAARRLTLCISSPLRGTRTCTCARTYVRMSQPGKVSHLPSFAIAPRRRRRRRQPDRNNRTKLIHPRRASTDAAFRLRRGGRAG